MVHSLGHFYCVLLHPLWTVPVAIYCNLIKYSSNFLFLCPTEEEYSLNCHEKNDTIKKKKKDGPKILYLFLYYLFDLFNYFIY